MSINLTLGAIVVLLAGLVLNFKSSKERQENGEWSSGLQWSYLLCMVWCIRHFVRFYELYRRIAGVCRVYRHCLGNP